jgi:hypothetical protein
MPDTKPGSRRTRDEIELRRLVERALRKTLERRQGEGSLIQDWREADQEIAAESTADVARDETDTVRRPGGHATRPRRGPLRAPQT